jgi:ABC-type transporter Mla subunit MlaD
MTELNPDFVRNVHASFDQAVRALNDVWGDLNHYLRYETRLLPAERQAFNADQQTLVEFQTVLRDQEDRFADSVLAGKERRD